MYDSFLSRPLFHRHLMQLYSVCFIDFIKFRETTVLDASEPARSSSILNFLGTHRDISMPIILFYHYNGGLDLRPTCIVGLEARPNIVRFPISLFHISF